MKKLALGFLLLCSCALSGQTTGTHQTFTYGFLGGAEFQTLNIGMQPSRPNAPVVSPEGLTSVGVALGIWGQWSILPVFHLRPALQFSQVVNTVEFEHPDGQVIRSRYAFSDVELPLHFLLSDQLQHLPVHALILFGGRLSWNFAPFSAETPLQLLPERAGLDLGIGAGFQLGKWTIQPELIYSYGLNNTHDFQNTPYDWAVGRVLRDRLSLRVVVGFAQ